MLDTASRAIAERAAAVLGVAAYATGKVTASHAADASDCAYIAGHYPRLSVDIPTSSHFLSKQEYMRESDALLWSPPFERPT